MKVIVAFALIAVVVITVLVLLALARAWANSRHPWTLTEDESMAGRIAFFAVKPGHDPMRLTVWRSPDDLDFSAQWADDRSFAENKVDHMNLGRRKQIGY